MISEAIKMAAKFNEGIEIVVGTVEEIDFERSERKIVIRISQKILIDNNSILFNSDIIESLSEGDVVIMLAEKDFQRFYVICRGQAVYDDTDINRN